MKKTRNNYRLWSAVAVAMTAGAVTTPALGQGSFIEEIIVTAQKRAESIQDVPIAVSAFSGRDMEQQQIDTAIDLQNYVPNMGYTGGGNYSIRGVGSAVGGTTGDVGVGVHINNVPIIVHRTTTGELYDVERVEVLRGPQGTLYGRNATGGVVNFLMNKPNYDEFSGSAMLEVGSFNSVKANGHINLPMGDMFSARLAVSALDRDGYTDNLDTGNDIDGRDQWSTRLSLGFQPSDTIESTLVWEHFEEDSTRNGGATGYCIKDTGPTSVGSTDLTGAQAGVAQLYLSRGCAQGSIYDDDAKQNPNSVATFGGRYGYLLGLVPGDVFANQPYSTDPRESSNFIDPEYIVKHDFISWDTRFDLSDTWQMNVLLGWSEDKLDTRSGSEEADIGFIPNTGVTNADGQFFDFQSGLADGIRTLTINDNSAEQLSAEVRFQSALEGPLNFNVGAFYYNVERENILFISTNSTSAFALDSGAPIFFDENPDPSACDYCGHQYFVTRTPYELESQALFGETYWDINPELKLTFGLRYTDDEKTRDNVPVLLFVQQGANGIGTPGHPPTGDAAIREQSVDFQETTGRIVLDWMPEVSFTDETLVYASFSRGYKAGGFNSPEDPDTGEVLEPYEAEYVNAYEIGTKNRFAGGRTTLNLTAFYYDYKDYQISFIEQFSARNTNVDATVLGVEVETSFELTDNLIIGGNMGWQDSEIKSGDAIDPFDRIQGQPGLTYLVGPQNGCVVENAELEPLIALINSNNLPASILANVSSDPTQPNNTICGGYYGGAGNPLSGFGIDINPSVGVTADVEGNELPNSPPLSASIHASYTLALGSWDATLRGDYSWKDKSYASHFNGENYEIESWYNGNISLLMENPGMGVAVQAFVKNVFDQDETVVGYNLSGQGLGLLRNATLLDPRIYGVNVRYDF